MKLLAHKEINFAWGFAPYQSGFNKSSHSQLLGQHFYAKILQKFPVANTKITNWNS